MNIAWMTKGARRASASATGGGPGAARGLRIHLDDDLGHRQRVDTEVGQQRIATHLFNRHVTDLGNRLTQRTLKIHVTVNGVPHDVDVEARTLLVHFIRENLGMTGTHIGCDTTNCGACTVLVNGRAVKSCTMFAVQADQATIATVEGLEKDGKLHPIQEGFHQEHGLQCGFCTPGMMMTAVAFLATNKKPMELEIREAISGNLCRCTGYVNIVKSIDHAARTMRETAEGKA